MKTKYKNITFCCQDCGGKISWFTAFYRGGRCRSCARKGHQPMLGKNHSKESRLKMSKSRKGHHHSKETILKIIIANIGKKRSKETCLNISLSKKGKKLSKEHRLKISKAGIGKKHSIETRLKMSKLRQGKKHPLWRGGISFLPYSLKWTKKLKLKIRTRDNYECQNCRITEKHHIRRFKTLLSVHHIDYNKQNCKEENLITLCLHCNTKANFDRDYWFAYYTYLMENK